MSLPPTHGTVSYNDRRDVDETFRRMASRQSSRQRTNRSHHIIAQSGQPVLRRGPQRRTQDAVTALGPIPILQPQQATFTSVEDEDTEHASSQEATPSIEHDSTERTISPLRDREAGSEYSRVDSTQSPASPVLSLPSPESPRRRSLHLPFRFGRSRRPSTTQSQSDTSVPVSRTPARAPFRHVRAGSAGASSIGDTSNSSTLYPSGGSTESTSGLRGGGKRTRDTRDTPHAPSPLHRMQRPSSPADQEPSGDPTKSPTTPYEDNPPHYLEGFWHDTPDRAEYRIRESSANRFWGEPPYSEPRRASDRQASAIRSSSSGADPSRTQRLGALFDDVFGTIPATGSQGRRNTLTSATTRGEDYHSTSSNIFHTSDGSLQPGSTSTRPRQFSSNASGASAQFSYYGSLPPSTRDSSNEHSLENDLSRLGIEGAVASNESPRLSASAVPFDGTGNNTRRPVSASSASVSPSNAASGPHGVSPLPSMPYTRNQGDQPLLLNNGNPGGYYIDATMAAMQGFESPLGNLAEQYRQYQAMSHFRGSSQARRPSHGCGSQLYHPHHFSNGPRMMDSRQPQEHPQQSLLHPFEHMSIQPNRAAQREERPGENYFGRPSLGPGQMMPHGGRVRAQLAAYERLHNPGMPMQVETGMQPFRHSMPQPTIPHERFNRPHFATIPAPSSNEEISSRPIRSASRLTSQADIDAAARRNDEDMSTRFIRPVSRYPSQGQAPRPLSPGAPPRDPTRQGYQQHNDVFIQHATAGFRPHLASYANYPYPSRDGSLAALAPGQPSRTTSRRSDSPLIRATTTARTRRRIPPEQRDQENDGDRSQMRREEENVNARYGEEEQARDTMNETPPRIGRVERRMQD